MSTADEVSGPVIEAMGLELEGIGPEVEATAREIEAAGLELEIAGPEVEATIGVVAPYDFALDHELWQWCPPNVCLHVTRTAWRPMDVTVEMAHEVSQTDEITALAREVAITEPATCVYACTSGSFVRGLAGERELVEAMLAAGHSDALTTSGAMLLALEWLGVRKIAVATPYDDQISSALVGFLREAGVTVTRAVNLGLTESIWTVPYAVTAELARRAAGDGAEAVFLSCTNLPTYDLIGPLEAGLGIPVLSANLVTMWAALHAAGLAAVGTSRLLDLTVAA